MFNNSGLSLEQAPPIKVVLRFFLTGSLFGIAAGLMMFLPNLNSITSPQALALTHTLTLGVMASFMFGALFQMLPVLAGVHIKMAEKFSLRVHYGLILGTIFLIISFFKPLKIYYILAFLFLGFSIFATAIAMAVQLFKIEQSNSSRGMLFALLSLFFTAFLGFLMLAARGGAAFDFNYLYLKTAHFSFGLFGWIALLIISVSFQVIEMFYVTPPYPKKYAKYLPFTVFYLLLLNLILYTFNANLKLIQMLVIFLIAIHTVFTLSRLKQKKRANTDATVMFWTLAMVSYILFFVSYILNAGAVLSAVFFLFFALGVLFAMVYKIVPFLVWFHLNAQGYFDAPMMHEVAPPKYAKINYYMLFGALVSFLVSNIIDFFWIAGAVLFTLSFMMLFFIIYSGWHKYLYVLKNGKKFDLNFRG